MLGAFAEGEVPLFEDESVEGFAEDRRRGDAAAGERGRAHEGPGRLVLGLDPQLEVHVTSERETDVDAFALAEDRVDGGVAPS